jgi:hypothetical protein
MRALVLLPLLLRASLPAPEVASPVDVLKIRVSANTVGAKGGERLNSYFAGLKGGLTVGQPQYSTFSRMPTICGFNVRPAEARPTLDYGAVGGWAVVVTPIRVMDRTVTIHVAWTRFAEDGKTPADRGDQEATLSPDESLPLDLAPLSPGARQGLPPQCDIIATSLRIGLDYGPSPRWDRRLVATDLWLIERLPGGAEHSQHTQVRGLFNVSSSFFFDDLTTADGPLDIGGTFTAIQVDGYVEVTIQPRSRLVDASGNTDLWERAPTTLRLKPDDVASIELPPTKGQTAPRSFTIRIQSKQIR